MQGEAAWQQSVETSLLRHVRSREAQPIDSIRYLKRRTVLSPRLPVVVGPRRRYIRAPKPFLNLGDVGLMVEGIGRRGCPERMSPNLEPERCRVLPHDLVDLIRRDCLGVVDLRSCDSAQRSCEYSLSDAVTELSLMFAHLEDLASAC